MGPDRDPRIGDFEINPLALTDSGPVALDALLMVAATPVRIAAPRPLDKLGRLFAPSSIAVAGVSRRLNIGRIILRNILRQGFDRRRVVVIKPECDEIDGCRCRPSFSALAEPVDLAVLSVAASELPAMMENTNESPSGSEAVTVPTTEGAA